MTRRLVGRLCGFCGEDLPKGRQSWCSDRCARLGHHAQVCTACATPLRVPSPSGLCGFCIVEVQEAHANARP